MAKRDRELRHRLEELFSSEAEAPPKDTGPIDAAGSADTPPVEASPIESVARTLDALPPAVWKTVLDYLPLPVYLKDREHTWIAINGACSELLGRPAGMLIGHTDKEQPDEAWQLDDLVLETGRPDDTQVTTTALDGSLHTRHTRRIPLSDEQGQMRYVLGIIEDSVKPAAEQAASPAGMDATSLARFQSIVEATPIPILITRVVDGRPLYVNARASAMFGVPREEILNHTTLEFYNDAADRQKILAVLQRDGRVTNYELRLKRPDGSLLWVMLDVQPMVYNNERAVLSGFYDITARKQAEEQLRYSEALYQSLIDTIPENLCRKDTQGRFTYGNHHYCELVGLSLEELIGKTDYDIHPPELAEKYRADDQAVMAGGKPVEFLEAHEVLGTGEQKYVRTVKNPLYDAQGKIIGIQIMFWDATELGRAEQALKLRTSALEATANGVLITDRAGNITWVNPAFTELTGYTFDEVVGHNPRIVNSGRQSKEFYAAMWQTILSGQAWHGELVNRRKDGREYDEEITITPVRSSDGEITHFVAIMQDIRERKRGEAQLLRFKLGLERSGDAIFITNLDGTIEYVNPAFEQTYGFSPAEAVGQTPRILKSGVIPPEQYKHFWQTLKGRGTIAGEIINKTKDGRLVTIEGANTPIIDDNGELVGFLAVHRDVTARKLTERQLAEAAQRLNLLIEHVPDLIYIKDRHSQWIIANQPVADSLGAASPAELIGKSDFDYHPRELAEQFYAEEQALLASGQPMLNHEERVIGPDGQSIWLESTKVPFRGPDGEIAGLIGVARNVTQTKEDERRLAEAAQRLQLLIENVPDLIYIKDRQGRFLVANQPVAALTGAPSVEALIGKTDLDFFPREFAEKYMADEQAIMQTGQPLMNMEEATKGPDGKPRWLSTTKVPFRNADEEIEGIVGVGRDVTERKLIEAERERLLTVEARRAVQLQTGSEIANAAATILDPDKLLPVVVELVRERYDLYYAGLFLVDGNSRWAELRAGTGEAGRKMLEEHHRLEVGGASMIGRCIASGEPRIALDVGAEAVRFSNPLLPRTRSEMALPLSSRGQIIGALTIQSTQLSAFTSDDISALRTMSSQIATAIENARLFQETQRRAEEQAVLFQLAQSLSSQQSIEQVLDQVYQGASQLLDTSNFYIGLYDSARHQVDFVINASQSVLDKGITSISADQGMTGYIIRTRRSLLIKEDVDSWLKANGLQRVGSAARSWLGVPLMLGDEVLGVMSIQSYTTPNMYDEHDRDVLYLIGAQAAIAIQNARLFEQSRNARAAAESRLRESQILQGFSQAVSQALDVPQVLDALVETLQDQLAFSHIAISLIEPETRRVTVVRGIGSAASLHGLQRSLDDSQNDIMLDIMRTSQVEVIDGWDERFDRAIYERDGHANLVRAFVPVRLRDETIGLIEAGYQRTARAQMTPEEVRVLGGLADQMAVAIDNARLLEQVQAALGETEQLYNASRQLASAPDLPGMLTALAQQVPIPNINRMILWLFDYDADDRIESATVAATWYSGVGQPPPALGIHFMPEVLQMLKSTEITGPQFINDVNTATQLGPGMIAAMQRVNVVAVAVLPLQMGDRPVGVLFLQGDREHEFVERETRSYVSLAQQLAIAIENRRLLEETSQRSSELATLNRIISSTSQTLDLRTMLDQTLTQTLEVFGFDGGLITMFNDTRRKLERIARTGLPGSIPDDPAQGLENSLCEYIFNSQQALAIEDFRLGAPVDVSGEIENGYLSYIGVPLTTKGRTLGTWCGFRKRAGPFGKNTLSLLQTVGRQVGAVIENAQLFEQAQARAAEMAVINDIGQQLSAALSLEELYRVVHQQVTRLLDTTSFFIGTYEAGSDHWFMAYRVEDGRPAEPGPRSLEAGFGSHMIKTRQPLLLNSSAELAEFGQANNISMLGQTAQAWLGVPLIAANQVVGVMAVQDYHQEGIYSHRHLTLFSTIANQTAIAIQNARLFEQTQRDAERERTINRITSRLRNAQSVEQVLNIATQELRVATRSAMTVAEIAPGDTLPAEVPGNGHGGQAPQQPDQATRSEA